MLEPEIQSECRPYAVWKTGFMLHIILFFVGLSFAVGSCDTILNEEDIDVVEANAQPERIGFTKIVEESLNVLKGHCVLFCGPFVFLESILSCVYFKEITEGCQSYIEDPMTSTLIYMLIVMGSISLATTCYCTYTTYLLVRSFKLSLPSMRNAELWQIERQRQRAQREGRRASDNAVDDEERQVAAVLGDIDEETLARIRELLVQDNEEEEGDSSSVSSSAGNQSSGNQYHNVVWYQDGQEDEVTDSSGEEYGDYYDEEDYSYGSEQSQEEGDDEASQLKWTEVQMRGSVNRIDNASLPNLSPINPSINE